MAAPAVSTPPTTGANPFIGLRPFDIDDSDRFFGRNTQTYELLRRLHTLHFVAVIGPSGCGKSSLIRAGVLAALRDGYLAEDGAWTIVMLEPGADPLRAWTQNLARLLRPGYEADALLTHPAEALDTSKGPIVILVDQFEDLFKYGNRIDSTATVAGFIHAMLATGRPDAKIFLILTMRSEYLPQCAVYPELAEAINESVYLVPRMDREQMKQAIVGQVRKGGGAITTELVERLLDDAAGEEDSLPVLQHALMQIWPKRQPWEPIGLELYPKEGGLGTFVDQHAELVYARLESPAVQHAAQSLFRAITETTSEGRPVRRPLPFEEVVAESGQPRDLLTRAIEVFRREGFLSDKPGAEANVDIAHEAIARQWKRLGPGYYERAGDPTSWREGWIVVEARERLAAARLHEATTEWDRNEKDKAYLIGGTRLQRLTTDLGDHRRGIAELERQFLDACLRNALWDRVLSREVLASVLMAVVILSLIVSGFLWLQFRNARLQKETAVLQLKASAADVQAQLSDVQASMADAEKLVAETAYRQAQAAVSKDPPSTAVETPQRARLYTQVWNDEQARQIEPILAKLPKSDIDVARFERVTVGPNHDELRYFHQKEAGEAQRFAALLAESGLTLRVGYVAGFENSNKIRPRHYELWLAAPPKPVVAGVPPSTVVHLPPPVITSIEIGRPAVEATSRSNAAILHIRGTGLDSYGAIAVDGTAIEKNRVVVSVAAPFSSARFGTDLVLRVLNATYSSGKHEFRLTNADGQSTTAVFTVPPARP